MLHLFSCTKQCSWIETASELRQWQARRAKNAQVNFSIHLVHDTTADVSRKSDYKFNFSFLQAPRRTAEIVRGGRAGVWGFIPLLCTALFYFREKNAHFVSLGSPWKRHCLNSDAVSIHEHCFVQLWRCTSFALSKWKKLIEKEGKMCHKMIFLPGGSVCFGWFLFSFVSPVVLLLFYRQFLLGVFFSYQFDKAWSFLQLK